MIDRRARCRKSGPDTGMRSGPGDVGPAFLVRLEREERTKRWLVSPPAALICRRGGERAEAARSMSGRRGADVLRENGVRPPGSVDCLRSSRTALRLLASPDQGIWRRGACSNLRQPPHQRVDVRFAGLSAASQGPPFRCGPLSQAAGRPTTTDRDIPKMGIGPAVGEAGEYGVGLEKRPAPLSQGGRARWKPHGSWKDPRRPG